MTEYKIVLYYEKPMPEFFQDSMEAMLKRGVEQGFISGYEFQKKELAEDKTIKPTVLQDSYQIKKEYEEGIKDERKPVQDGTSGLDTRAEKGAEVICGARKPREASPEHKAIRSNKSDNRKKGGGKV